VRYFSVWRSCLFGPVGVPSPVASRGPVPCEGRAFVKRLPPRRTNIIHPERGFDRWRSLGCCYALFNAGYPLGLRFEKWLFMIGRAKLQWKRFVIKRGHAVNWVHEILGPASSTFRSQAGRRDFVEHSATSSFATNERSGRGARHKTRNLTYAVVVKTYEEIWTKVCQERWTLPPFKFGG